MYRIVHISDSHFGRIQAGLPERLISAVHELRPHAVVATGDVTQRARRNQFRAARGFLTSLPKPLIVAPGNHDVPLFNVAARFLWKLRGFNKYLRPISAPYIAHEQALIVPVDTTMSFTIHRGRVSKAALAKARVAFGTARSSMLKIALLHHPVVVPDDVGPHMRLQDADETLREFAGIGVDLILSGHTHRPFVQIVSAQGTQGARQILAITAGTAVSSRIKRDYGNSFYLLEVLTDALHLTEYRYAPQSQRFLCVSHATFVRPLPGSWSLASLRHAADESSFKPNSN
jgi:3',5'-cyclic AMP phosphodiesterase CpdA